MSLAGRVIIFDLADKGRNTLAPMKTIPFVDLKTPYLALKSEIDRRIHGVLDHGQFILGPEVEECEKLLAEFTGAKHAITVSSGTDALMMALMVLNFKPGDEIITTPFTFVATAEIPALMGIKPVFVDIEPDTFNLDVRKIEAAITPKTKGIMPVSLFGQPADMAEISDIARRHNLYVIEDAAQSFGATYKGKHSCNLSDIGCTSFFPAKVLGCFGDGGAVFTNNDDWAKRLKEIRAHGQERRYYHTQIGINGRLDTIQCAVLIPKLGRFPWEVEQRQALAKKYHQAFASLEGRLSLNRVRDDRTSVWAQYTVSLPNRDRFGDHLKAKGVPTSVHYPLPVHQQPAYKKFANGSLPISEKAAQEVISLPLFPDMTAQQQSQAIDGVLSYFN
jgi:UDP-2-acetamido-2-deoxy-ribo-hexuluronate aminotransferase